MSDLTDALNSLEEVLKELPDTLAEVLQNSSNSTSNIPDIQQKNVLTEQHPLQNPAKSFERSIDDLLAPLGKFKTMLQGFLGLATGATGTAAATAGLSKLLSNLLGIGAGAAISGGLGAFGPFSAGQSAKATGHMAVLGEVIRTRTSNEQTKTRNKMT